jgi:hypothetical protein
MTDTLGAIDIIAYDTYASIADYMFQSMLSDKEIHTACFHEKECAEYLIHLEHFGKPDFSMRTKTVWDASWKSYRYLLYEWYDIGIWVCKVELTS